MRFVISYKKKVDVLYIHDSTFNTVKISRPILPEKIYKVKLEAESYGGINVGLSNICYTVRYKVMQNLLGRFPA